MMSKNVFVFVFFFLFFFLFFLFCFFFCFVYFYIYILTESFICNNASHGVILCNLGY